MTLYTKPGADDQFAEATEVDELEASLPGTYDAFSVARVDATDKADGSLTAMDTGQTVTAFGNTPLVVASGVITHTPVADTPAANVAGYMQSRTSSGKNARVVWAVVKAEASDNTGIVLVLPGAAWSDGSLTAAEVHHVEYPSGSWHTSRWTGSSEVNYLGQATVDAWNDGVARFVAAIVDDDGSVTIRHTDGSISTAPAGTVDTDALSEYAVVESYRSVNTSGDLAHGIDILAWGIADGDQLGPTRRTSWKSLRDMALAQAAATPDPTGAMVYKPGSELATSATGSLTDVDTTNVKLTVTAPASGSLLIDVEAWVNLTNASTNYLWQIRQSPAGGSGTGAQRVHIGTCNERKRCRWLLSGLTPGTSYTWYLQEMAASATGGGLKAGSSNGYYLTMSATPL